MTEFKIYSFVLFPLIFTFQSKLNARVIDSQEILRKVDSFVKGVEFEDAFKSQTGIRFEFSDCLSGVSCGDKILGTAQIDIINKDQVEIKNRSLDGSVKSVDKIDRSQWDSINRNYLRAKISKIESFGYEVNFKNFTEIPCPRDLFEDNAFQCVQVSFRAMNKIKFTSDYVFEISNHPSGLAQILSYTQTDLAPLNRTIKYRLSSIISQ